VDQPSTIAPPKEEHWYGEYLVKVWKMPGSWYGTIPWRFSITEPDGREWQFSGIPNYLETKRKALKRAWYRVKWMREGTMGEHYQ
jgi:hypothetical protein